MKSITCKFGGSSLADAAGIRQAVSIVNADPQRRFVVPSAPGKRHPEDRKVTDLLFAWHDRLENVPDANAPRELVTRFMDLAAELGVDLDVEAKLAEIAGEIGDEVCQDYVVSRGEYLNALILAEMLDAEFVSPRPYIIINPDGSVDPETYARLAERLKPEGRYVIPGYYGALRDGTIKTFSRGGSDITGAIVARATDSEKYENWTDISGFMKADPRIVPDAGRMAEVTYRELRELAYMGAKVIHEEAIYPVQEAGIPVEIRNTRRPHDPGTTILRERTARELVCGIAGLKGFSTINVVKTLLNRERGFLQTMLSILDKHQVLVEHIATGIDAITVVARSEQLDTKRDELLKEIGEKCRPNTVQIEDGYSIIATVGQGMEGRIGMAARLCYALAKARVCIHLIDQGSPENNIIVGVRSEDHEKSVRAIYREFAEVTGEDYDDFELEPMLAGVTF
jgi:aspartate kinase